MANLASLMSDLETELPGIEACRKQSAGYTSQFPMCSSISFADVQSLRTKGRGKVYLIDTRTSEEREVSMVHEALSQKDFEALDLDPEAEENREATLIPYCTIGFRSGLYGKALVKQGWDNDRVRNGEGIVVFSYDSKLKLIDPSTGQEVNKMHVFGKDWDTAHSKYEAVVFGIWGQAKTIPATVAAMCAIS